MLSDAMLSAGMGLATVPGALRQRERVRQDAMPQTGQFDKWTMAKRLALILKHLAPIRSLSGLLPFCTDLGSASPHFPWILF